LAYLALLKRALETGAFVQTPSRYVADEVVALARAEPARVRVVPHAPAPPASVDQPQLGGGALPLPKQPYVLAVGTVEPRKDYPSLVRAFTMLETQLPDISLVIAGSGAWGDAALEDAVNAARPQRVVRFGYVSDATRAGLMAEAELLVYPSIYEGFGMVPLEAMAAGLAVVATDGGSLPEVLGDAAKIVPVGDVDALASAMAAVLEDSQLRAELVRKGRERAAQFSWSATAEEMVDLYRDALDDRSGQ
jgi:glycosyltransferase involved in cell wall biosynthesis